MAATPVRLTRRGRAVVVLALTGGLLGGAVTAAGASFAGSSHPAAPQLRHAVVRPGDTLWAIAARTSPGRDPRATIDRIVALNGLDDAPLIPGEQIVLPPK